MSDFIKLPVVLLLYLGFAPLLGLALKGRQEAQRWVLGLMVFITSWQINKFTVMVGSIEWYRGHTKGFEASLISALALALLTAGLLERRPDQRLLPWAVTLWLGYCALSAVSVVSALVPLYVAMAFWKHLLGGLILAAAWNRMRGPRDMEVLLVSLSVTLILQAIVALHAKYGLGYYQVRGWFEHQNSLATWAYLGGLPLLAAALSSDLRSRWKLYAAGFAASAVLVQSALSRASLAVVAIGAATIVAGSTLLKPSLHKVRLAVTLAAAAAVGLALSIDTIIARLGDSGNAASAETRVMMNRAAQAMLEDRSTGIGWNNFAHAVNPPFTYGDVIDDAIRDRGHRVDEDYAKGVVESHYWLLLSETGYQGFWAYLLFISATCGALLFGAVRLRREAAASLIAGVLVAVVLIYLHSNLERVLTQTKNQALWLILLGATLRISTWQQSDTRPG